MLVLDRKQSLGEFLRTSVSASILRERRLELGERFGGDSISNSIVLVDQNSSGLVRFRVDDLGLR